MPFNPVLSAVALTLDAIALVGYLLTHFGVISGFIPLMAFFLAGSLVFWIMSIAGLKSAPIAALLGLVFGIILEGALFLNWWGLGLVH